MRPPPAPSLKVLIEPKTQLDVSAIEGAVVPISCTEYSGSKFPREEYKPNVCSIQCIG